VLLIEEESAAEEQRFKEIRKLRKRRKRIRPKRRSIHQRRKRRFLSTLKTD
jgi:hypothetical protein